MLEECKMATKSDFYFICQVDQRSVLYKISTSGGKLKCHDMVLEELLRLETSRPGDIGLHYSPAWYIAHSGSILDVIPSTPDSDHYVVDVERKSYKLQKSKRSKLIFSAVIKAGQYTVSLCNTLQDIYVLNRSNYQWRRQKAASSSIDLSRKIKISGFVDLVHDAFMVSDASTTELFLFDLKSGEWFVVEPPRDVFLQSGLLSGRCIFAEGFIYSCSDCGLIAFELIDEDNSFRLGLPILLELSWKKICGDSRFMSFDSICKDQILDSITFCIVQGCFRAAPSTSRHTVASTTVQVQLKKTARGTKEPIAVGHVDISLSFIHEEGRILTNYAFAV
ncbi:hypothetical protein PR202_ga15474 [Eleusine coracana subsp. coracana]|uniref:Uncharacterized protein n=1 Tax=Eleusine coracana subsp. coracana TaxID=191504 RepID=A0AAV5CJY0_ELECO|nr:hypothetical protein PR202_ga15474 [Eleusine coracana subsp. coracana]